MKNLLLLLCSLLLNGVFGDTVVKVSVKEGDSVTIKIKPEDINRAENLVWKFNDRIIAQIDLEVKDTPSVYPDGRFRDRLNLERQTGSLTITNIRSEDSGEYKLQIIRSQSTYKTFRVSVSVSVMEGDSVTLQTGVTDGKNVKWKFNGADIPDSTFINCEVNNQTGDLNITKIRPDQSGEYEVMINGSLHRIFHISIRVKSESISVNVGSDFKLCHEITDIQRDDVIQWTFEGTLIAHSHRTPNNVPDRFTDRLHLGWTGCLIINNFGCKDSGLYEVNITGSKHIIHKTFNVTERGLSAGQWIGVICGVVLLVFAVVGVIVYRRNKYKQQKQKVTVMRVPERQSVTIESDVTKPQSEYVIQWSFRDKVIHTRNKDNSDKERLIDRLQVNDQTGSLTIKNIRTEDAGLYKVKISSSSRLKSFLQFITGGGPSYYQFNVIVTERIKTVMMGGYVTLETDDTEIQTYDKIQWTFENEKTIIAEMTVGTKPSYDSTDERFRDRLMMNPETGDLTILAITTELSGVYRAKISSSSRGSKERDYRVAIFEIAYKGESITLNTKSEIQRDSEIKWISEDETILVTGKNRDDRKIKYTDDEIFRDRLEMNHQTGDLTITKLRQTDDGLYTFQQINSDRKISCRIFSVCVHERTIPVKSGDSVTLETGVTEIQRDDVIQWRFRDEETIIAEITVGTKPSYDSDERFTDRLMMNRETGDLTIKDFTAELSGVYRAKISSSRETENRTYRVVISGPTISEMMSLMDEARAEDGF